MTLQKPLIAIVAIGLYSSGFANCFGQTKIMFSNDLNKLKTDKTTIKNAIKILGNDTTSKTRSGAVCDFTGYAGIKTTTTVTFHKLDLELVFSDVIGDRRIKKQVLKSVYMMENSQIVINNSIKMKASTLADIKAIFGNPVSVDHYNPNDYEYLNGSVNFIFSDEGTLKEVQIWKF